MQLWQKVFVHERLLDAPDGLVEHVNDHVQHFEVLQQALPSELRLAPRVVVFVFVKNKRSELSEGVDPHLDHVACPFFPADDFALVRHGKVVAFERGIRFVFSPFFLGLHNRRVRLDGLEACRAHHLFEDGLEAHHFQEIVDIFFAHFRDAEHVLQTAVSAVHCLEVDL